MLNQSHYSKLKNELFFIVHLQDINTYTLKGELSSYLPAWSCVQMQNAECKDVLSNFYCCLTSQVSKTANIVTCYVRTVDMSDFESKLLIPVLCALYRLHYP